jgi:hypothetical protein
VYNENIIQLWVGIIWERAEYIWHVDNKKNPNGKDGPVKRTVDSRGCGPRPTRRPFPYSISVGGEREKERE